jgi:hypothetical protein
MEIIDLFFRMGHKNDGVSPGYGSEDSLKEESDSFGDSKDKVFYFVYKAVLKTLVFMNRSQYLPLHI